MTTDLTYNGRLTVHPFVTETKVEYLSKMIEKARRGGFEGEMARTQLRETLSTSDAPFSFAHLVNVRNLPLYDEETPDYDSITDVQTVTDFRPATFYALKNNFAGLEHGNDNDGERISPLVPELDTYQYAFGYTQESTDIAVQKRGFKVGISLEAATNDVHGLVTRFPGDMLKVARKTDEYVVIRALKNGVTINSALQAGTDIVTGKSVGANSPASPEALRVAIRQINERRDSAGNRVPTPRSMRLVVAQGAADSINWSLGVARGLVSIQSGQMVYSTANLPGDPLNRITSVIESEFLTGDEWYLVPEKGTTERPALIKVQLAGYTAPEVYVSNFNGAPFAGGASSSPFQAFSFDNDSVDLKLRQFVNAGLFSEDAVVWSDGSGTVPSSSS